MIKDQISFDKLAVATHFNQFFSNITDKLVSKLPPVKGIYGEQFVKSFYKTNSTLSLKLVTADKVLSEYLECNNLMYDLQSGFRQSFSTDSCLIHLSDYILNN